MNRTDRQRGASSLSVVAGLGVVGAVALGWWFSTWDKDAAQTVDRDRLVTVERRDVIHAVTASGRVEPLARVAIMSRASGILQELYVEEGDQVEPGQPLAQLDREQLEAERAQDDADLTSAQARVAAAKARHAESVARLDDPELAYAERNAERVLELFAVGDVSESERDDAVQALETVRFRLKMIEQNLPVLAASVQEAEANLKSAEAALERTDTALRETRILCPIDGVVLVREKEVGDGVSSILTAGGNATQIMSLGDLSEMHIEARVDEVDLGRIHVGMPALITVDAFRTHVLDGQVERIAPAGSVDNNGIVTFEVRISVEDPDGLLRPDMTADARLVLERRDQVPTLPQRAIHRAADGSWNVQRVVGEGLEARLEVVPVTLGVSDGLITEITTGLEAGDQVLVPTVGAPRRGN